VGVTFQQAAAEIKESLTPEIKCAMAEFSSEISDLENLNLSPRRWIIHKIIFTDMHSISLSYIPFFFTYDIYAINDYYSFQTVF